MTQVPEQHAGGGVPATEHQWTSTGLEDFSVTDAVLPRIKIDHQNGMWVDNLGGLQMATLRFIALGLVKQRVLFHHVVENEDVPMCKSADYQSGFPNPDAPSDKSFPWQLSGFDKNDYPPDAKGNVKLPVRRVRPQGLGLPPGERQPLLLGAVDLADLLRRLAGRLGRVESGDPHAAEVEHQADPHLLHAVRRQSNKPPFLAIGRGTLKINTRGSVTYSVPSFSKEGESPRDRWMEFSEQFTEMRSFLVRPPVREQDGTAGQAPAAPQNNEYSGPPQQAAPAPAAEAPAGSAPAGTAPAGRADRGPLEHARARRAGTAPAGTAPQAPPQPAPPRAPAGTAPAGTAPAAAAPQQRRTPPAPAGQGLPF